MGRNRVIKNNSATARSVYTTSGGHISGKHQHGSFYTYEQMSRAVDSPVMSHSCKRVSPPPF